MLVIRDLPGRDDLSVVFLFLQWQKTIAAVARIVATIGRVMAKFLPILLPDVFVVGRTVNLDFFSYDCNLLYQITYWLPGLSQDKIVMDIDIIKI